MNKYLVHLIMSYFTASLVVRADSEDDAIRKVNDYHKSRYKLNEAEKVTVTLLDDENAYNEFDVFEIMVSD